MQEDYLDLINQSEQVKPNLAVFLERGSMASDDTINEILSLVQSIFTN